MAIAATHRLRLLLGDNVAWGSLQSAVAFVDDANTFFKHDFVVAVREICSGKLEPTMAKEDIVNEYQSRIKNLDTNCHRHYQFLNWLLDISTILECEKFTFQSISNFKDRDDVKKLVKTLKTEEKTEQKDVEFNII